MFTRRRFLQSSFTLMAALAGCSPRALHQAVPEEVPPAAPVVAREPGLLARLAVVSDPHLDNSIGTGAKLKAALNDLRSVGADHYAFNGDLTNHAWPSEYDLFRQLTKGLSIDANMGNHEFYHFEHSDAELVDRFCKALGYERPYHAREVAGVQLIFLSGVLRKGAPKNPEWAWLTAEQVNWFEQQLKAKPKTPTLVFLHQTLNDTVAWSWGGNGFSGVGEAQQLRQILSRNPQVKLWFSGHTHQRQEGENQVSGQGSVTFVGVGSSFYTFVPSDKPEAREFGGFVKDLRRSDSRVVDVYADKLVVRARDHAAKAWVDSLQFEVALKARQVGCGGPVNCLGRPAGGWPGEPEMAVF